MEEVWIFHCYLNERCRFAVSFYQTQLSLIQDKQFHYHASFSRTNLKILSGFNACMALLYFTV